VAKGYWINQSDVTDEAGHAIYAKAVAEYLARRGAKTLVFSPAGRQEVVEGSPAADSLFRNFPTMRPHWRLIIPRNTRKSRNFGATPQQSTS